MGGERDRKLKNDRKCVQFKIFFVMAVCACLGFFFLNVTSVFIYFVLFL